MGVCWLCESYILCFYPVIIPMGGDLAAYAPPMAILLSFSALIDVILSSIAFEIVMMYIDVFVKAYAYEKVTKMWTKYQCFLSLLLTLKTASMLDNIQTILSNIDSVGMSAEPTGILVIHLNQEWFWKLVSLNLSVCSTQLILSYVFKEETFASTATSLIGANLNIAQ